jgi:hypothetical protein
MTGRRRTAAMVALGTVAFAVLVVVAYPYVQPGSDALWALAWGGELARGDAPDIGASSAIASHPLTILLGALLSLPGPGAALVAMRVFSVAAFCALLYASFRLGRSLAGVAAGLLAVALVVTRPEVVGLASTSGKEIPFAFLVVLAAALAVEAPIRNWRWVLGLLALAGLIRPEAWALAVAYAAWLLLRGEARTHRAALVALAVAAPLAWGAFDLVLAGDPLESVHSNRQQSAGAAQADGGDRAGAADRTLTALDDGIPGAVGWGTVIAAGVVVAVALAPRRRPGASTDVGEEPPRRPGVLLTAAAVAIGAGAIAILALADAFIVPRFLLAVALLTAALAASALGGARRSRVLALGLAAGLAVNVASLALGDACDLRRDLRETERRQDRGGDLVTLANRPVVRSAFEACPRLLIAARYERKAKQLRGLAAQRFEIDPSSIETTGGRLRLERGQSAILKLSTKASRSPRDTGVARRGRLLFASSCRPATLRPAFRGP